MLTVSAAAPSARLPSSPVAVPVEDQHGSPKMDQLLAQLRRSMVELILQGDDVTRQMWQMYSVFEEIFGRQPKPFPTSAFKPLVGDKIRTATSETPPMPPPDPRDETPTPTPPPLPPKGASPLVSASLVQEEGASVSGAVTSPTVISPKSTSSSTNAAFSSETPSANLEQPKVALSDIRSPTIPKAGVQKDPLNLVEDVTKALQPPKISKTQVREHRATGGPRLSSNPLLETIGALTSNPDSDDSDLDIVYQQLRYRGRHRRTDVRMRAHRSHRHHHHHQFPSSDPESVGYAGSNSIDSGYKSLCATPEVSDSLSAPEVRRSASDVSASDSSTTSGRPRSSDECNEDTKAKIKMGTRVIAGKGNGRTARSPRGGPPMSDVNLDHLMYLRQSLRTADRQDYPFRASRPPSGLVRDDVSPSALTDEEWTDQSPGSGRSPRHHRMMLAQHHQQITSSTGAIPTLPVPSPRDPSGGGASPRPDKDFLLSGVEYYDLESIAEFPQRTAGYVTLLEENMRSARVHVRSGAKSDRSGDPGRRLDPMHKLREPSISGRSLSINQQAGNYGPRRNSRDPPKVTTDSKLTEAAIRVLEMIEDFRLEEAMEGGTTYREMASGRGRYRTNISPTSVGPHAFVPRFRKNASMPAASGTRPASTGSLIGRQITGEDVISIASSSSSSYAGSAEHHVYEEIMYDLVGERHVEQRSFQPVPPEASRKSRNRLLPLPPSPSLRQGYGPVSEESIIIQRSHHPRASSLYSVFSDVQERRTIDNFPELEWHMARERRNNLTPDFPA